MVLFAMAYMAVLAYTAMFRLYNELISTVLTIVISAWMAIFPIEYVKNTDVVEFRRGTVTITRGFGRPRVLGIDSVSLCVDGNWLWVKYSDEALHAPISDKVLRRIEELLGREIKECQ